VRYTLAFALQQYILKPEGCLNVHLPHEIMWNASFMKQGNVNDIFLARHVSGTYAHHQEHQMMSRSIWFSALHTPLTQPSEHKPPVPTQTDLYNTPQTALIDTYIPRHTATTHTLHIISFFAVQKTICCNSTSYAPDDERMYPKHVQLRIHQ